MILDKTYIAAFTASFGLLALGAAVHGQTLINPSSTTYEYTSGTVAVCCGANANTIEQSRVGTGPSVFGSGILNDGLVGNQSYLDTTSPGNQGGGSDGYAYQIEGGLGAIGPDGSGTNTASFAAASEADLLSAATIVFNLGTSYSNLNTLKLYGSVDIGTLDSQPSSVSITGNGAGSGTVNYTPNNVDTHTLNSDHFDRGTYWEDDIPISGVTGNLITITFGGPTNTYAPLNEIDFTTTAVPEPASLGLLSLGGLALLRRRGRRA